MKSILTLACFCFSLFGIAQNISAKQVLDNAITYHDPDGKWESFNSTFTVDMSTPGSTIRKSEITINLPSEYFSVQATKGLVTTIYTIDKEECKMMYNDVVLDSAQAKEKSMSCDRAMLYKNYYTYLYGLPMKLKDFGTNLSNTVEKKTFKGKTYLVLKVTYDKAVGSDVWYFYFNPKTYAMEIYQFFKTDENGNEKKDSGEYILLSEEMTVNGIKMPKVRDWYYNKDDKYLGTDTLVEN